LQRGKETFESGETGLSDEQIYEQAFDLWNLNKDRISNCFSIRPAHIYLQNQQDMVDSIGLFLRIISKVNAIEYNPNWKEIDFLLYKVAPINFVERISFVTSRPTQYQSYMQLVALFDELQKILYKHIAMNNPYKKYPFKKF
jgi:FMN phosphatase YigB (HAD superfamily)